MVLRLSNEYVLSPVERKDKDALVEHLQVRAISRNTLTIPYPYTEADAEAWIDERESAQKENRNVVTFAIRNPEKRLIGAIGVAGNEDASTSHRAEVGYWLARPYWGKGITTEALSRFALYAFNQLDVMRLTAKVFPWNEASVRVLRKVGFEQEGRLRRHQEKDGELVDVLFFGLLRDEFDVPRE